VRKTRAEAFSDGVFAVAATLLVFSLVGRSWSLLTGSPSRRDSSCGRSRLVVSFVSVGAALALYAFIVLFYVAMPILRENRGPAVHSAQAGSNPVALGGARAAEPGGRDLGQDS
jgi:hypothetical protein